MHHGHGSYEEWFKATGIDRSRFVYEPRVLWTMQSVASSLTAVTSVTANKDHFRNGGRWPIRLTHLLVSPVGYSLREFEGQTPTTLATFQCAGSIISLIDFIISSPFSLHWMHFNMRMLADLCEPTMNPAPSSSSTTLNGQDSNNFRFVSDLFGVTRWGFEIPYDIPQKGAIQFDLSHAPLTNGIASSKTVLSEILFDEECDAFNGHGRHRPRTAMPYAATVSGDPVYPAGPMPTPVDAFGSSNGTSGTFWNTAGHFQSQDFRAQNANRGKPKTGVRGFNVHIDQITFDDTVQGGAKAGFPLTPMSQRMSCRARSVGCGTGEWWWREGAPLALVCPTITPAMVCRLPDPIWLGPGEDLKVEMTVPKGVTINQHELAPTYNFGMSFAGYAVVDGMGMG